MIEQSSARGIAHGPRLWASLRRKCPRLGIIQDPLYSPTIAWDFANLSNLFLGAV